MITGSGFGLPVFWGRRPTATSRLYQPGRRSFWALAAVLAIAALLAVVLYVPRLAAGPGTLAAALLAWTAWAALAAWLLGYLDVYRHVPRGTRAVALLTGVLAGALTVSLLDGSAGSLAPSTAAAIGLSVSWEVAKLLGLALVAATVPALFRRPLTGILTGMLAGLGSAYASNIDATIQAAAGADSEIGRVFRSVAERGFADAPTTQLGATGLTAFGLVWWTSHPGRSRGQRALVAAVFLAAGIAVHLVHAVTPPVDLLDLVVQWAVFLALLLCAVLSERRWFRGLTSRQVSPSVITSEELETMRTPRRRRHAVAAARRFQDADAADRVRMLQRARLGYLQAVSDPAPQAQTRQLAELVTNLRGPDRGGTVPPQRAPRADEQRPGKRHRTDMR